MILQVILNLYVWCDSCYKVRIIFFISWVDGLGLFIRRANFLTFVKQMVIAVDS